MAARDRVTRAAAGALLAAVASGCLDSPRADEPVVFRDNYVDDGFQPFDPASGADPNAVTVDPVVKRLRTDESPASPGNATLRITVPTVGRYAGGAVVATLPRNLSGYNALTFWAKADDAAAQFDVLGLANDNTPNPRYLASISNLAIGGDWAKYLMPIPLPAKLASEAGMLFFAASAKGGAGYHIWLDDVKFEQLGADVLGAPVPRLTNNTNKTLSLLVGDCPAGVNTGQKQIAGANGPCPNYQFFDAVQFPVTLPEPTTLTVAIPPAYLTFLSANSAVAIVDAYGLVTAVGCGVDANNQPLEHCSTTITAQLGGTPALDTATVNVTVPPIPTAKPTPPPARAKTEVVSLLTRVYANQVTLAAGGLTNTWGTDWSNGGYPSGGPRLTELQVDGDNVKKYSALSYVGIDFSSTLLDITAMNFIHLDVWTPDADVFKVKLVDYPNGDSSTFKQAEVTAPPPAKKSWVAIELPLSSFVAGGLASRAHLAQIIFSSSGTTTVYVDNLYFHQ